MFFSKVRKVPFYIFLILVLVSGVIFSFLTFRKAVYRVVENSSAEFLKETSSLYAGTFQVKLNDQLFMLESQARYFTDVDMDDYNAVKAAILGTKGIGEFKRIAVANASGMTINNDGKSSGNILMKDYFKKAMQGHAQISSNVSVDEDGEEVLTLAVPVLHGKTAEGVITGTFSYSVLDNIFSVDTFGGQCYSIISDKSGKILIGSKNQNNLCHDSNWINFLRSESSLSAIQISDIHADIQDDKSGIFAFAAGDEKRIVVYTPIGLNDWYVISTISADYILSQRQKISLITFIQIAVMLLVFAIVTIFICYLVLQNVKVQKANARYAISSKANQNLIFEFDFASDIVEFTGNTMDIFGEQIESLPFSEFGRLASKIHESERNFLDQIRTFIKEGGESYTCELRISARENVYEWYKLSGIVVFDREKMPMKFIGNIFNVNAQIEHEQKLKTMAETDLLSGLLNKVSLEKKVTSYLESKNDYYFAALFIVDMDNFKQVNDRLGHAYGDQAICDTANKLSLVFSEKDFIGRIGGDEFCVFMCLKSSVKNPKEIIEKKAGTLKEILTEEYFNGKKSVEVTASIGISFFPSQADNFMELFKKADRALYYVKNSGKNNYAFYKETMNDKGETEYV